MSFTEPERIWWWLAIHSIASEILHTQKWQISVSDSKNESSLHFKLVYKH